MMFVLGLITGVVISIFNAVLLKRYEPTINRTIKQTHSRLQKKGSIIEPESEVLDDWVKELKDDTTI